MLVPLVALLVCIAVSPANGIRCYEGQSGKVVGNSMKAVDCPTGQQSCATIQMEVEVYGLTINITIGQCRPTELCAIPTCSHMMEMAGNSLGGKVNGCSESCCFTDLCNNANSPSISPVLPPALPLRGVRCWDGDWPDVSTPGVPNTKRVKECESPTEKCFVSRMTSAAMGESIKITVNSGICMEPFICQSEASNCDSVLPAMMAETSRDVSYCNMTCCDGDLCNTPQQQFGIPLDAGEEDTEEEEVDTEPSCLIKKKKHNACCGPSPYNNSKFACCVGASGSMLYKANKKGCCNGKLYKTKKFACVDGALTKLKKKKNKKSKRVE